MYCSNCGVYISNYETTNFCKVCGNNLHADEDESYFKESEIYTSSCDASEVEPYEEPDVKQSKFKRFAERFLKSSIGYKILYILLTLLYSGLILYLILYLFTSCGEKVQMITMISAVVVGLSTMVVSSVGEDSYYRDREDESDAGDVFFGLFALVIKLLFYAFLGAIIVTIVSGMLLAKLTLFIIIKIMNKSKGY